MRVLLRSAVALTLAAVPQQAWAQGWSPALELRVLSSSPNGTTVPASSTWKMTQGGDPLAKTVTAGASLCSVGIGGTELPPGPAPATIWKLNGEYLGEQAGRYNMRVTSRFLKLAGQESSVSTTQPLSLREGDAVILDALSNALDGSCPVHTLAIEARLVMLADDPALAEARYSADLWFVHTPPDGQERRERLIANLDGSGPVPFMFSRIRLAVPQIDPRQGEAAAVIQLAGALRSRPRADGQIDVDIDTDGFIFRFAYPGKDAQFSSPRLRKTVTLRPDETTAIDFPPPGSGQISLVLPGTQSSGGGVLVGRAGNVAKPAADGPALEVVNDRLVLHTSRFFKGHKTQLLITLRRVQ
jgi:hypothetical protein